jgi:hypothetical protein
MVFRNGNLRLFERKENPCPRQIQHEVIGVSDRNELDNAADGAGDDDDVVDGGGGGGQKQVGTESLSVHATKQ